MKTSMIMVTLCVAVVSFFFVVSMAVGGDPEAAKSQTVSRDDPILKSLPSNIIFPYGFKVVSINGKDFIKPGTEDDFRKAEAKRQGIKAEDVSIPKFECCKWVGRWCDDSSMCCRYPNPNCCKIQGSVDVKS